MRKLRSLRFIAPVACLLIATIAFAQRSRGRAASVDRGDLPHWEMDTHFAKDVFTFVRIKYPSDRGGWGWEKWTVDYPDSDLNFSYRLQQLTSLKVHPEGKILELTDKELFDYPWIYIVEPGDMDLTDEEVASLRRYLLNGGFLMVDDFWGEREWENFYAEIKRVFPDREPEELSMDHPIFHCVFDLGQDKQALQVPNVYTGIRSQRTGVTWERDGRDLSIRGIYDDRGRLMVVICHNTDNGDGWEREGENEYYFRTFSEKRAYPLGINVVFYAMTH